MNTIKVRNNGTFRREPICPIIYHPKLERSFAKYAAACRVPEKQLRQLSEVAIRRRHHKAVRTRSFFYRTDEEYASAPYQLKLWRVGGVYVFFRLEDGAFVIRGYGWDFYDAEGYQESDEELGVGRYYDCPVLTTASS